MDINRLAFILHDIYINSGDNKSFVQEIITKIADYHYKSVGYFDKGLFERVCIEGSQNVYIFNKK